LLSPPGIFAADQQCGDLNNSGGAPLSSDALLLLKYAVGQPVSVSCPAPPAAAVKTSARNQFLTINTTDTTVATLDVTYPAAGNAVVMFEAEVKSADINQFVLCSLLEGATQLDVFDFDPGDNDTRFDLQQSHHSTIPVTEGPHTYHLVCLTKPSDSAAVDTYDAKLVVTYFPGSL